MVRPLRTSPAPRDLCDLHGFVERRGGNSTTEKHIAFFTDDVSDEEEERSFHLRSKFTPSTRWWDIDGADISLDRSAKLASCLL